MKIKRIKNILWWNLSALDTLFNRTEFHVDGRQSASQPLRSNLYFVISKKIRFGNNPVGKNNFGNGKRRA